MEQHWEESEKVLSWREMQPGVYRYHGIEQRGMNDYGKPLKKRPSRKCTTPPLHCIGA